MNWFLGAGVMKECEKESVESLCEPSRRGDGGIGEPGCDVTGDEILDGGDDSEEPFTVGGFFRRTLSREVKAVVEVELEKKLSNQKKGKKKD